MTELSSGEGLARSRGPQHEFEVELPSGSVTYPAGSEPIDFAGLCSALRRHLRLIAVTTIVAALVTWIHLRMTPREYRASAVIRLVDTRRAIAGDFDSPVGQPLGGSLVDPIQSEIEVLLSRSIATKVVTKHPLGLQVLAMNMAPALLENVTLTGDTVPDSLNLNFDAQGVVVESGYGREQVAYGAPATAGSLQFTVISAPLSQRARLITRSRAAAVASVRNNLFAKAREETDVVDVSYTARDPVLAKQIVDTVVSVFQESNAATARDQSRRRRIFVGEQLRQTDSLLISAQDRLNAYRTRNHVNSAGDVVGARVTALLNKEEQFQDLRAQREVLRVLLDTLAVADGNGRQRALRAIVVLPTIARNQLVQRLFAELFRFERARDSLTTGRWSTAPTNPDVVRLESLISTTQANLLSAVQSQIVSLDARTSSLGDLLDQNSRELERVPAMIAGESRLRDQVKSTALLASELRNEYQSARIAEAVEAGYVEIIDFATIPTAPTGAPRRMQLLAGSLVGLLLGITIALLRERANTAIRHGGHVQQILKLPRLVAIPPFNSGPFGTPRRAGRLFLPMPFLRAIGSRQKHAASESLITVSQGSSAGAEAFRVLRTSLIFSQSIRPLRTIVVTSPSPKDGKTTTAANLAVAFAQHGLRVLLIDCDLRRARLHMVFRMRREPGLADVALGRVDLPEALRATMVDRLDLLSAGVQLPNPSDALRKPVLQRMFATLGNEYDLLIVDSAPVHVATDATVLGRLSDGVLLVIRAGRTERAAAVNAVNRLWRSGVHIIGAVLNDPDGRAVQALEDYGAAESSYDVRNDSTTT